MAPVVGQATARNASADYQEGSPKQPLAAIRRTVHNAVVLDARDWHHRCSLKDHGPYGGGCGDNSSPRGVSVDSCFTPPGLRVRPQSLPVLIAHEPIVAAAASGYPSNCTARRGLTDIRGGHRGRARFRCARPELTAMIYAQITNVTRRCPFPKSRSNVCARPPRVLCIKRPHSDGAFTSNAFPRGARALVVLVESRCA